MAEKMPQRSFDKEFKISAIKLVLNSGRSVASLAKDLRDRTNRQTDLIPQTRGGLNGGLKEVYEYIKMHPGHNTKTISAAVSRPVKTEEKWIKNIRQKNLIEFKGSKKTGGYYIKTI